MAAPVHFSDFLPHWLPPERFFMVLGAGVIGFTIWAVSTNFWKRDNWSSRIKNIQERRRELQTGLTAPKKRKKPESSVNFMRSVAMKFELVKNLQLGKAETTLIQAGFRSKDAILIFAFFNLALPVVLTIIGVVVYKLNHPASLGGQLLNYIWPMLGMYMGLKLPWVFLGKAKKNRYIKIQRALSDMLDLMTVCAEAGLSLAAALDRVARELGIAYPEMAEEVSLTSIEIGFLPDRNKALSNLAERCDLKEVRGIVSVLIQTEKYGTPIAQALRVLSKEFREQRMMRAEAKAARLPALMTLPMIVFILPTLFIIIIAPAAITTMATFADNPQSGMR